MLNEAYTNSGKFPPPLLGDSERQIILVVNLVIVCSVISLFGSIANVINMIVFYRQGLNTITNISFFSLAVSDLLGLVFQLLYNLFFNPLFLNMNLPLVHTEVQFLTAAAPRGVFSQITCLITAYITAERCLCVVFPLHIKRIITPKISASVITLICASTLISVSPLYFTSWRFYPESNLTLLGLAFTKDHIVCESTSFFLHGATTLLSFLSVVIFTLILTIKLGQNSVWRQKVNVGQKGVQSLSQRDRTAIAMVVFIAGILVVCYTPVVVLALTTFLEPEFSAFGRQYNLYHSLWSFVLNLEVVNSSVNILLYYKMSSKYRRTCSEILPACLQINKLDDSDANTG